MKLHVLIAAVFLPTTAYSGLTISKGVHKPVNNLLSENTSIISIADLSTLNRHAHKEQIDEHILVHLGLLKLLANKKVKESDLEHIVDAAFIDMWIPIEGHLKTKKISNFHRNRNSHYKLYLQEYNRIKPTILKIVKETAIAEEIKL